MGHDVPVGTATSFDEIVAANIRAARARAGLGQALIVERMRALGFTTWHRQTLGKIERGERRLLAAEVMALAWVLETTISALLAPTDADRLVEFPSGGVIAVASVRRSIEGHNDEAVRWDGDRPVFDPEPAVTQPGRFQAKVSRSTGQFTGQEQHDEPAGFVAGPA